MRSVYKWQSRAMRIGSASSFTHMPHNGGFIKAEPTDRKQATVCLVSPITRFHRMGSNESREGVASDARRDALYKYTS